MYYEGKNEKGHTTILGMPLLALSKFKSLCEEAEIDLSTPEGFLELAKRALIGPRSVKVVAANGPYHVLGTFTDTRFMNSRNANEVYLALIAYDPVLSRAAPTASEASRAIVPVSFQVSRGADGLPSALITDTPLNILRNIRGFTPTPPH